MAGRHRGKEAVGRRRGKEEERVQREGKRETEFGLGFTHSPTRPYLLILPKQCHSPIKPSNTCTYEAILFKPPQPPFLTSFFFSF